MDSPLVGLTDDWVVFMGVDLSIVGEVFTGEVSEVVIMVGVGLMGVTVGGTGEKASDSNVSSSLIDMRLMEFKLEVSEYKSSIDPRLISSREPSRLERPFLFLNSLKEERGEGMDPLLLFESSLTRLRSGELMTDAFFGLTLT
jgi:hypothetical protein